MGDEWARGERHSVYFCLELSFLSSVNVASGVRPHYTSRLQLRCPHRIRLYMKAVHGWGEGDGERIERVAVSSHGLLYSSLRAHRL